MFLLLCFLGAHNFSAASAESAGLSVRYAWIGTKFVGRISGALESYPRASRPASLGPKMILDSTFLLLRSS